MRWLLDSNVWIEGAAGAPHAANALVRAADVDWCGFSAMSRLEVFGFPFLTPEAERQLETLLGQFHEVAVSSAVIQAAIQLRKQVKIKVPDAIIAAPAIVEWASLVTRNVSDFKNVPGLTVVDPATL
jgi:predicted nucleic acid-binding protein